MPRVITRILGPAAVVIACAVGGAFARIQTLSLGGTQTLTVVSRRGGDLLVTVEVAYAIITPIMFVEQLQPFIPWKTERGLHVVVGGIGTTEVGTTTASIQSDIRNLHDSVTPALPTLLTLSADGSRYLC
jgi:hypothetical protein